MTWIAFALGAVLAWGMYGPALHKGQVLLGSPLTRKVPATGLVGGDFFVPPARSVSRDVLELADRYAHVDAGAASIEGLHFVARILERGPRRFDQEIVAHARRTGGDTAHAAKACIEMPAHDVIEHDRTIRDALHQIDATARRIAFVRPRIVRRAGGQAEPAMYALINQFGCGRMMLIERLWH